MELLIAAALIGVLAMFATQAFRASASDIRIEDAKSRALLLVSAAQRYYTEYPGAASFPTGSSNKIPVLLVPRDKCFTSPGAVQNLVDCGFLEYRQVAYDTKNTDGTRTGSVDMWFTSAGKDNVRVCFEGKGRANDGFTYCTKINGDGFDKTPN